jgi:putative peptidoglycan binding protein/TIR domain-containing protein
VHVPEGFSDVNGQAIRNANRQARMNMLWQGARGPAVKELQVRLKEAGFDPGYIDGIFGPSTTAAVTAFQRNQKISADGIAGPMTFAFLNLPKTATRTPRSTRTKVFISYSHADKRWFQMLQVHLAPLERNGIVLPWDDTRIAPGTRWRDEIANNIRFAKVAVLLISAYFMASDFIARDELPRLLAAAKRESAVILPVIISPCLMGSLSEFQAVNPPSEPLVDLSRGDRDRVWVKTVEAITIALNE